VSTLRQLTPAQKWVIVLIAFTLSLALANLGKAVVALRYAVRLPDLSMTVSLDYLVVMGAFWFIAFCVSAVGLSRFRDWGRWAALASVTLYQGHVWINHLLFDASDYAHQTIPRNLLLSALPLLLFWGSLSLPAVRRAFDGGEERL
jgi:hypothetical protein